MCDDWMNVILSFRKRNEKKKNHPRSDAYHDSDICKHHCKISWYRGALISSQVDQSSKHRLKATDIAHKETKP